MEWKELRFKIDSYTPATIPMARLAEYMTELAMLLGEAPYVHFVGLEEGSTVLVHAVEFEAVPKVEDRLRRVREGGAPPDAAAAFERINRKLRQDNGVGVLLRDKTAEIIKFPGREAMEPVTFGAFNQEGTLDGVVIRIGGTKDVVPVHLQAGETIYGAEAQRSVAKRLAEHIFGNEVRVTGLGRWYRDQDGKWVLARFFIRDFEVLQSEPLSSVVGALREVKGSEWAMLADPWAELAMIRDGANGTSHETE